MTTCSSGFRESNEETERRRFADLGEGCSLSSIAGALSKGSRSCCVGSKPWAAIADAEALTIESISQNWTIFMIMGNRPIVLEKRFN